MTCHHGKVPKEMPEVAEAQRAYKQADLDALKLKFRARARLGLACIQERKRTGSTQDDIAETLVVVKEQVRRYEAAYREWQEKYPDESLD